MKSTLYQLSILLLVFVLSCKKKEVINLPPTANAGTDVSVSLGQKVTLNGSLSKDPENTVLAYNWSVKTKPGSSTLILQNATSVNLEFTPDAVGTYVLTLRVTDDHSQSASADVTVTVGLPGKAPTANAGASLTTTYGNKVVLDGSASSDPDGDKLTYTWSFKTRPAGSASTLAITNANQAKAEFEPDVVGQYVLTLTVNDNVWAGVPADVMVTVNESPTIDVCPQNGRIVANTTWKNLVQDPTKPDYVVCKDISLEATLTLEPGVVVAFKQNTGLTISDKGLILASGTAEKPIVLTGEQKIAGFWDGVLLFSNDARNELNYVEISYGGGKISSNYYGQPANLNVAGNTFIGLAPSSIKITNCSFTHSKGYGIFVSTNGNLLAFSKNKFSNINLIPIQLPASQVDMLDENSTFSASNGINVVGIYGGLNSPKETTWGPFKDGTKYRFVDSFGIGSGLVVLPGAYFEVASQKTMNVGGNGYLIAKGTADKRITFTGEVKIAGSWGGIFVDNQDVRNEISYGEVSYGGGEPAWLYADKGNIILSGGFGSKGRMKIVNSTISNSSEVGIANYRNTLVLDSPDSNTYSNNAKGNIGK